VEEVTPFEFAESVVVVTGAGSGIGRQAALQMGAAGARVVIVARRDPPKAALPTTLESVTAELKALGVDVLPVLADLLDEEATHRVVDSTLEHFGRCDVLINNASFTSNGPILTVPWRHWPKAFRLQVVAPLQLVQGLVPGMIERGIGRVVNVSSVMSIETVPNMSVYSVSKRSMERFSEYLHLELGGQGVSFNTFQIDRVVKTEGWYAIARAQGDDAASVGATAAESLTPAQAAAQLVWMVQQPASWSGQITTCVDIAALGGPPV
jgi:NAD(P)-dependent dehydrogenase (short-subunit alcohol dehydrogenase family)